MHSIIAAKPIHQNDTSEVNTNATAKGKSMQTIAVKVQVQYLRYALFKASRIVMQ